MSKKLPLVLIAITAIMLSSCAVTAPKRAPYAGADNIGAISPAQILGTWRSRIVNPIEGEDGNTTEFTFASDGTMTGTSSGNAGGQVLAFSMSGSWQIEGERISTTVESMEETSGNPIAALAQGFVSSLTNDRSTVLNVYEASDSRLVVVAEDTGQAQEWLRVN